ncbi:DNA/RNA non-specific endonuclease [Candidatus Merdisoma sp. JLR.KK006]|uniref:DNA/RNA non-specific endonuclease n=1 Tax=Candidatus Merdisoma sp. JLR.KK006 TaxID=3112626 RepID=UPI002FF1069B
MKKLHERYTSTKSNKTISLLIFLFAIVLSVSACGNSTTIEPDSESEVEEIQGIEEEPIDVPEEESPTEEQIEEILSIDEIVTSFEPEASVDIPDYAGELYVVMNDNIPFFTKDNLPTTSFEYYSELDELGRCGVACANIGQDLMPTEEREGIGQIKPSGWQTIKYDNVDGKYLYNRCHLVGYQLSGENANEKNLITGTRYLNVQGMLPFENMIADYVKETGNHVLYRVAPIFDDDDLLAYGVLMEGWSVEDEGDGICFNVFVYNVQPDVVIDYATGNSQMDERALAFTEPEPTESQDSNPDTQNGNEPGTPEPQESVEQQDPTPAGTDYILNTNTKKFHYPTCGSVKQMAEKNKQFYSGNRDDVIGMGYDPCKKCNP